MRNDYKYHITLASIVAFVVLVVNVMSFYTNHVSNYLFDFDLVYIVANSAHFVALSITSGGINVKDE